jgi:hypothetical protein
MSVSTYIIRGGDPGAERLAVVARAMRCGTSAAFVNSNLKLTHLGC